MVALSPVAASPRLRVSVSPRLSIMSPIQILKLVGFATGAMLHLYIAWLIWSRRLGTQQSQSQPARLITILNLCLGVWFLGNLFITLHELLLGRERLTFLLRAWDVMATTGVALLPAALLHAHVAMWASLDHYRTLTRRNVRLIGVLQFYVVAIARSGPNDFLWVTFILLSLLPIFFVAYHVYRYRIVDVAVRDSLVYAVFALVFIAVYTYGVRRLDQFLVARFEITPGVVEVILLLGMVALAGPLVRTIDRAVHQLFTSEIGLYRDV